MKPAKLVVVGLAFSLGAGSTALVHASDYTAVMPPDVKWVDAPSIGKGAKTAVIHGDPKSSGPFVMRLKVPPNSRIDVHTHPADENVTILSGTLYFAAGDKFDEKQAKAFGPGGYFSIAKGKPMYAFTKDKEALLQLHGTGPWGIEYMKSAEAKKQ